MSLVVHILELSLWTTTCVAIGALLLRASFNSPRVRYAILMGAIVLIPVAPILQVCSRSAPLGAVVPSQGSSTLFWAWIVGAIIASLRLAFGSAQIRRLRASSVPLLGFEALSLELASSLGLKRFPPIRISTLQCSPCVTGFFKLVVIVPSSVLANLPTDEFETLLAHEFAHIRRWDHWANLLQIAVETLFFFHPAVWLLTHLTRTDRELCCDDLVIAITGRPRAYVRALAYSAGARRSALAQASSELGVPMRMRRILTPNLRSNGGSPRTFLVTLALGLALAAFTPVSTRRLTRVLFPSTEIPYGWRLTAGISEKNGRIAIDIINPDGPARIELTQPSPSAPETWFTLSTKKGQVERFEGWLDENGDVRFQRAKT